MLLSIGLAAALVVQSSPAQDAAVLEPGATREIRFAEGETERTFVIDQPPRAPFVVFTWATSADCDPTLRVTTAAGDLIAFDDDMCDAHCSVAQRLVLVAEPLVVHLSVDKSPATVALHFELAPETERSAELCLDSPKVFARATELRENGEYEESARVVRDELARLYAELENVASWCVTECLPPLARLAYLQGEPALAVDACERSLAIRRRYLPDGHRLYRGGLNNLALSLTLLGRERDALPLFEQNVALAERSTPPDGAVLAGARFSLAGAWHALGEPERAVELVRRGLDALARGPADNERERRNGQTRLADYAMAAGDLRTARALYENALAEAERSGDAGARAYAQANLGWLLWQLGDAQAARPLQEASLSALLDLRGADELEVQRVRVLLAMTLGDLGDGDGALELERIAHDIYVEKLPPDHPRLLSTRGNLAISLLTRGEHEEGLELLESCVAALADSAREDDPQLLGARRALALGLTCVGDWDGAYELLVDVDRIRARTLPADHPLREATRASLLGVAMHREDRAEVVALIRELTALRVEAFASAARVFAPREVAARTATNSDVLAWSLTFGAGYGAFPANADVDAEVFTAIEATRAAEIVSARLVRAAAANKQLLALRERARAAARDVARLASSSDVAALARAVRERDDAQRALIDAISGAGDVSVAPTPAAIAKRLPAERAAVSYWRYERASSGNLVATTTQPVFVAFVVRPGGAIARFELGPASAIERAVGEWRDALLTRSDTGASAGEALRKLVLDPLAPALEGARVIDVALDDVLHAVALDALPRERGCVGDTLEVRVLASLAELAIDAPATRAASDLVVFGGIDFGSPARQFAPLPSSAAEARAIAELFESREGEGDDALLVTGVEATAERLAQLAPDARFLHVATHGVSSSSDAPSGTRGAAANDVVDQQVRGLSPMSLCALAFAGANGEPDEYGARLGLLTAEELATLDLSGCELAVLSACDTNAGVRRAGQGVQSLQKALHMAGARTVVTSLWRVSDSATRELMVSFYRRVWIDGQPPARALWAAKRELRERRAPLADWAGWVLSGD